MKESGKTGRNRYDYWKMVNMMLACAILILAILIFVGSSTEILIPVALFLGVLMCSFSGIMELSRGKRVIGYTNSVFAGILMVALIISVIQMW